MTIQSTPIVAVDVDGKTAQWDGGQFSGDAEIVAEARLSAEIHADLRVGQADVTAGDDTAVGAAAALASFLPGRTRFTVLPAELEEFLMAGHTEPETLG